MSTYAAEPETNASVAQTINVTRNGSQPSTNGRAEFFTDSVRIDYVFQARDPARASGGTVTFEPSAQRLGIRTR
jgi:hypothetical protein